MQFIFQENQWNSMKKNTGSWESIISVKTVFNPFRRQPHKMVKHTQTMLSINYLSVFEHLWGWRLKA